MVLKKRLMVCTAAMALLTAAGTAVSPAAAAPWTVGFVVGAYEYAFRYGGRASDFSRGAEIEPGVVIARSMAAPSISPMTARPRSRWRAKKIPAHSRRSTGSPSRRAWIADVRAPVLDALPHIWNRAVASTASRL